MGGRAVFFRSHFGATLQETNPEPAETPNETCSVATFVVQTAGGRHPVRRTHRVPVSRGAAEEVAEAVRRLARERADGDAVHSERGPGR